MTRTVTDKQGNENSDMDDGERTKEGEWGNRWANNGSRGQRERQGVRKGDLGEGGGYSKESEGGERSKRTHKERVVDCWRKGIKHLISHSLPVC